MLAEIVDFLETTETAVENFAPDLILAYGEAVSQVVQCQQRKIVDLY